MIKHYIQYTLLLLSIIPMFCSGCSKAKATTMRLEKTEGTVAVADSKGKNVDPAKDLMLYNGYGMETNPASYAWINLDSVKLAKMDEKSDIEIQKEGKELEILVNSGNLYFHVTKPLEDDETMNIRTSTMSVGIRGTRGWVEVGDDRQMKVYILEGKVACSIAETSGDQAAEDVSSWEMAEMTLAEDGKGTVHVEKFTEADIPDFVKTELNEDNSGGSDPSESSAQGGEGNVDSIDTDGSVDLEDLAGDYTCDENGATLHINAEEGNFGFELPPDENGLVAVTPAVFITKIENRILYGENWCKMTAQGEQLIVEVESDLNLNGTYHK